MTTKAIRLAVTMGDPAGIGPEIIAKAAYQMRDEVTAGRIEFIVIGSAKALDTGCRASRPGA
jgi:4-hydroxy-L-threonine phosphate dehydrogenase PdxA